MESASPAQTMRDSNARLDLSFLGSPRSAGAEKISEATELEDG